MSEADRLLEDVEILVFCLAKENPQSYPWHTSRCERCDWRKRYLRYKADRENREAAELAEQIEARLKEQEAAQ